MYKLQFSPTASRKLEKLAQRDPNAAALIMRKILWLSEHTEEIAHRPIKGSEFFSLHSGTYRIPYLTDKIRKLIIVDDIAQHDAAYNRIKKLKI